MSIPLVIASEQIKVWILEENGEKKKEKKEKKKQ
jgi:hypothetical protein